MGSDPQAGPEMELVVEESTTVREVNQGNREPGIGSGTGIAKEMVPEITPVMHWQASCKSDMCSFKRNAC